MEFAALTKLTFYAGALLLTLSAGCARSSAPPSQNEVEAFRGKPMPQSVRQKINAAQTPRATPTVTPLAPAVGE